MAGTGEVLHVGPDLMLGEPSSSLGESLVGSSATVLGRVSSSAFAEFFSSGLETGGSGGKKTVEFL